MYIFLDESGDLGFEFYNKNPSTHFIITLLVCHDYYSTVKIKAAVKHTIKNKLNHKNKRKRMANELKSISTTFEIKKYFYNNINTTLNWSLYTVILDKKKYLQKIINKPNTFKLYNKLSYQVLQNINFNTKNNISLYVDLSKSAQERKTFNEYLLSNFKIQFINRSFNIDHQLSHNNACLQAADLFSWGIMRKHTMNDTKWYEIFKSKIVSEKFYVENEKTVPIMF